MIAIHKQLNLIGEIAKAEEEFAIRDTYAHRKQRISSISINAILRYALDIAKTQEMLNKHELPALYKCIDEITNKTKKF